MDSESKQSSGMSGQIEDLIVDLGNEKFMTRHEALGSLREMLPMHERAIAAELVRWIQLYGKSDAGGSASFVNKAAAISTKAEFFAPLIFISPFKVFPPLITNLSIIAITPLLGIY